uniref:Uncharacterized protein n=1 Tax=viral metagenome TaxID=1070528 RepID=A0A6H1ZCM4_9ZZZZ
MKLQYQILLSIQCGIDENNNVVVNPFYNSDLQHIKNNYEYAKNIYKYAFKAFKQVWHMRKKEFNMFSISSIEYETLPTYYREIAID